MTDKFRCIELTQGYVAIISTEDFRRVNRHSWQVHKSAGKGKRPGLPYARGCVKGKQVYLHRFIMNTPPDQQCDHKNHFTLDCRRSNLENVTHLENQRRRRNVKNVHSA